MIQPRWFTWGPPRPQFVYPAGPLPRVAVVHENLRVPRPGMSFHPNSRDLMDRVIRFRPDAVAGRYGLLASVAREFSHRNLCLRNAVIVFREPGEDSLSESTRDELWQVFEVPVFEQILSAEGELVAYECEAHCGLHIASSQTFLDAALINTESCECGGKAARMVSVAEKPKVKFAAA